MLIGWLEKGTVMTKSYNKNNLKGIGGWLYVVAIGVVANPLYAALSLSKIIGEDSNWLYLSLSYKALFWGRVQFLVVMLLISAYVAFLFFNKRRKLPTWYMGPLLLSITFGIIDLMVIILLQPNVPIDTLIAGLTTQVVWAAIWIPYMFKSERVKLTFVED